MHLLFSYSYAIVCVCVFLCVYMCVNVFYKCISMLVFVRMIMFIALHNKEIN